MDNTAEFLFRQNPWWDGKQPDAGIVRRKYLDRIFKYINSGEILIIGGVRRSGKTKLMLQTIQKLMADGTASPDEILFISCDAPEVQKLEDPIEKLIEIFRKQTGSTDKIWLFLDEVQMVNNFPARLKALYDEGNTHIIISGSSSHLLISKAGSSLSGRYLPITVYPLGFSEYLLFKSIEIPEKNLAVLAKRYELISALQDYIRCGGFPAVAAAGNADLQKELITAYYDSILFRDVIQAHELRQSGLLGKMIHYLITNISNPLSYSSVAKIFGCSTQTVQDFLSYAQDANLLYEVMHFSWSLKEQIRRGKKIYAVDTGLRNRVSFTFSNDRGRLYENAVFVELMRRGFQPYYWSGKNEVDFVVQTDDNELTCINVCITNDIPPREYAGLNEFEAEHKNAVVKKIVLSEDTEKIENGIVIQPIWKWLSGIEELGEIRE